MTLNMIPHMTDNPDIPLVMQHFATEVVRYLVRQGSRIRLFAFAPSLIGSVDPKPLPDQNGHVWPHYYYVPRKFMGLNGREEVLAFPCSKEYVGDGFRGSTIVADEGFLW
jgi:hypothetical protein